MPSEARLKFFLKKYKIRALKFIVLLLNCALGPPNLGVRGEPGPWGPPGSASETVLFGGHVMALHQREIVVLPTHTKSVSESFTRWLV